MAQGKDSLMNAFIREAFTNNEVPDKIQMEIIYNRQQI